MKGEDGSRDDDDESRDVPKHKDDDKPGDAPKDELQSYYSAMIFLSTFK